MKRVTGLICILFFLTVFQIRAQVIDAQAMFIYNFSRLIEWPVNAKSGNFVIGVLGKSDVYTSLSGFVSGKKVGNQDISVKHFNNINEISQCHILFVSFGKSGQMPEIISQVKNNYNLVIGEKKDLINNGAAINFVIDDNKLRFQLNAANAEKYQLKISKSLQEMAML